MNLCGINDIENILEYIGDDYDKCAYLYIDLKKYGFDNEHVKVWKSIGINKEINAVVLQYYNGMHIFSRNNEFSSANVIEVIADRTPMLICGMKETLERITPLLPDYEVEYGKVLTLNDYTGIANNEVYRANREDLKEIAELLSEDEELGKPYGFELLYKQLTERFDEGFGRNWIRRDESGIVSHCATYAEIDNLAVISGGIVREDKRGKGEYPGQLGAMCRDLKAENIKVISYYYGGAKTAHRKVGFEVLGDWVKLIRKYDK